MPKDPPPTPKRDENLEIVLAELGRAFDLEFPAADGTIGEKVRQRLEGLTDLESPRWGVPGELSQVSLRDAGPLRFYYRPHLFPGMSEPLRLGHALQFDLLPTTLPADSPVQISALLESYCHLSGDLIGWHPDGEDLVLWIADVSGHGVRAGLAAAVMYFLIDTLELHRAPEKLLSSLNRKMVAARNREDRLPLYLTAFFVRLSRGGAGTYASAGHPDMLVRHADAALERLPSTGLPIGLFADSEYRSRAIDLTSSEGLFLFTDGVVEVRGDDGAEFGMARLQSALEGAAGDPEAMTRAVYTSVNRHCPSHALDDDMTLLAAGLVDF